MNTELRDLIVANNCQSAVPNLWIFGYGSLLWKVIFKRPKSGLNIFKPNFEYTESRIGYISGYSRRFNQGSTSHRGTVEAPGRVANLIESRDGPFL